ncbi:hypothetical protein BDR04DRAFT_1095074 [Suillus decipiens]|nr:hypothetical protein BDR04DRAFT_1095074 [Suillus decipiens]
MYKDFPSDKSVRFSAPENPFYTKLYSSDKLTDVTNSNSHKLDYRPSSHCYLHSSVFLDELQSQLLLRRHVKISLSTLFRTLQRLDIARNKRNEEKRAAFMNRLSAEITPDLEMLMFRDEAAKNKHILDRQWDAQHVELVVFNPDPLSE